MNIQEEARRPLVSDDKRAEIIILVVENAREAAKECIARILEKVKYPFKLTLYDNTVNSPNGTCNTSKIWNKLVRESTCGYICIMDDDSVPNNDFIAEMVKVLDNHPEAAAVVPTGDEHSHVNPAQKGHSENEEEFVAYDDASGFCFMFRREMYDELGGFDENFLFYGQDSEWTFRVSLTDKVFYIVPKARVNHKDSVSSTISEKAGKLSKQEDIDYCQGVIKGYKRQINIKSYNPWKKELPYQHG